jgi:two-component system phosphate regulon sensor histidine kinase PhoR
MDGRVKARIRKLRNSLSLTSAIVATAVGVILPVLLSTSVGIVALAMGKTTESTIFGVLVISFAAAAIGSAIVVTVLLGRKNRIARLQADFTANITHDLRTPLCSIRMYAQTLQMGRINDKPELIKQSVDTILRETERLEAMIDRVLTWRAASKDRDELKFIDTKLNDAVDNAVFRFERMIVPGEVDLKVIFEADDSVRHDKMAVQSIVLNLLVNAYKYTHQNKKIVIKTRRENDKIELIVKDNGIGIPKGEIDKIFDPFYRVDSRLSGQASGAGLGLAIVRHLVKLHDGAVFVDSTPEAGTTFIIQFPIVHYQKE